MKKVFFILTCMIISIGLNAQSEDINGGPINSRENGIIDGVVLSTHTPTKRLIPYEHVREADLIWSKRVWRTIDLREKMNHPLYFPLDQITSDGDWVKNATRWSLWTVIRHHLITGDLTLYEPQNPVAFSVMDGDQFKYPLIPEPGKDYNTDEKFRKYLNTPYLGKLGPRPENPLQNIYFEDSVGADGQYVYPDREIFWYTSEDIIQYRLKEDWFIDKERSVLDVRILGIAPVIYDKDEFGNVSDSKELFWLYFPTDCRYVFNNYFVYNEQNGSRWMSFDDYFWKRRFTSFIHKEENVFDRKIEKYRVGVDALMESKKITEEIRILEHDVWSY